MGSVFNFWKTTTLGQDSSTPLRTARKNYHVIHSRPLPLEIYPLPAFIPSNPLSYLRIFYNLLVCYLGGKSSHSTFHHGYYSPATRSVHVTDSDSIRALWECGFFGKGSLSRSEPEWLERERRRLGLLEKNRTAGEVTNRRREERRQAKRERARVEREELEEQLRKEGKLVSISNGSPSELTQPGIAAEANDGGLPDIVDEPLTHQTQNEENATAANAIFEKSRPLGSPLLRNQEHLQLTPQEAFFLTYGLGVLKIHSSVADTSAVLGVEDLLALFRRTSTFPPISGVASIPPDDPFIINYVVYHHFRSLGWVIRPGIKFAVDWLLYARGPVFAHAEFAVIVLPSYSRWNNGASISKDNNGSPRELDVWGEKSEWWWFHAAGRVQTQVMKSLVLCYVEVPSVDEIQDLETRKQPNIGEVLKRYKVREFVIRRWTPNRNRD